MGVNNVQNMNKAELYKLAKQRSGQQTTVAQQSWMTSTGSIFNAPNARSTSKTSTPAQTQTPSQTQETPQPENKKLEMYQKLWGEEKGTEIYEKKFGSVDNGESSSVQSGGSQTRSASASTEKRRQCF